DRYTKEDPMNRPVVAVVNFPPKQIATFMSEGLVLGAMGEPGVALLRPGHDVELGTKIGRAARNDPAPNRARARGGRAAPNGPAARGDRAARNGRTRNGSAARGDRAARNGRTRNGPAARDGRAARNGLSARDRPALRSGRPPLRSAPRGKACARRAA